MELILACTHLRWRLPRDQPILLKRPVDGRMLLDILKRIRRPAQSVTHDVRESGKLLWYDIAMRRSGVGCQMR